MLRISPAMPGQAQWAEWNTEVPPYGVGVEEEVMLVDPERRWGLAQRIGDVLHELPPGSHVVVCDPERVRTRAAELVEEGF